MATTPQTDRSGKVFDTIITRHALKNDRALAKFLALAPSAVSKIRNGHMAVSAEVILRMHETTGIPVAEIRTLLPKKSKPAKAKAA